jgi:hypothetical protein
VLLLLLPIALGLLVLSVLGLAGVGPLTDERRGERTGLLGAVGPAVGLLASLILVAVSVLGTVVAVGVPSGDGEEDRGSGPRSEAATPATPPTTERRPARATVPRAGGETVPGVVPEVTLEPIDPSQFPTAYAAIGRLDSGSVLQVRARGFEPFGTGVAEQCARTRAGHRCFNQLPVQFGEDGEARFQYAVTARARGGVRGGCRVGAPPCTVVVRAVGDDRRAQLVTVFGARLPRPGRILVSQTTDLSRDGEVVTVRVRDYPPNVEVAAALCVAPGVGASACGAPGPSAPIFVGPDGRGRARLTVRPGPVGIAGASCGRDDPCGISVGSPDVFARAPVVPITFAGPPGAAYDPTRLLVGLALAVLLAAIAAWLIMRTDWSAVGEADAPEIDDVDYADLDAIIAALPPEELEEDALATR